MVVLLLLTTVKRINGVMVLVCGAYGVSNKRGSHKVSNGGGGERW